MRGSTPRSYEERQALRCDEAGEAEKLAASAHVIGVEPGAELEPSDVTARYRKLVLQLHPDKKARAR